MGLHRVIGMGGIIKLSKSGMVGKLVEKTGLF